MYLYFLFIYRELREFKQRNDALIMDIKRRDKQIKELQSRVDSGDGCKYHNVT